MTNFTKITRDIECEAMVRARKLATTDFADEQRSEPRTGAELKEALIQIGNEELARYMSQLHYVDEKITTNEEKQQWAHIFGCKFYAEYKARCTRLIQENLKDDIEMLPAGWSFNTFTLS